MDTHGSITEHGPAIRSTGKSKKHKVGEKCFTHFLREPKANERFVFDKKLRAEIRQLANLISVSSRNQNIGNLENGLQEWENTSIPSGYTYLAQLVAHDTVFTSLSNARGSKNCDRFQNNRMSALNLDTLYGSHPRVASLAYSRGQNGDQFRNRLCLGQIQFSKGFKKKNTCPKSPPLRDIGRVTSPGGSGKLTEPCLADTRNDNNAILSQLVTVFCYLHNGIVDRLEQAVPKAADEPLVNWQENTFLLARQIVTYIYLNIVQKDLLKRLLDPKVYDHYSNAKVKSLHKRKSQIPLEFSHAAFRFGHSMVRPSYFMGRRFTEPQKQHEVISFNSSLRSWKMPFDETWIIDWSDFFEMGVHRPRNYSGKITPNFSGNISHVLSMAHGGSGLAELDLQRSASSNLWSIDSLLTVLIKKEPDLFAKSSLYQGDTFKYKAALKKWFKKKKTNFPQGYNGLLANPPFSFFVLFEAEAENDGYTLGTLGSVLVADVLFSALKSRFSEIDQSRVRKHMKQIFGTEKIADMPTLIRAVLPFYGENTLSAPLYY